MSTDERTLLVIVIKGHRRVEAVMEGFLELGIPGATVIDAKGMGQIISSDLPIFSGFRSMFPGSGEPSYMILSVLMADQVDESVSMLRDVCDDFAVKGTGIVFTLPVTRFVGSI